MENVWEAKLDDKYLCKVERTQPYEGLLSITEGANVVFSKEVYISYDASFGPDAADVMLWEDMCVEAIDGESK